jgi:hypothetical protein
MGVLGDLLTGLAAGTARAVDPTAPLSERTRCCNCPSRSATRCRSPLMR